MNEQDDEEDDVEERIVSVVCGGETPGHGQEDLEHVVHVAGPTPEPAQEQGRLLGYAL